MNFIAIENFNFINFLISKAGKNTEFFKLNIVNEVTGALATPFCYCLQIKIYLRMFSVCNFDSSSNLFFFKDKSNDQITSEKYSKLVFVTLFDNTFKKCI